MNSMLYLCMIAVNFRYITEIGLYEAVNEKYIMRSVSNLTAIFTSMLFVMVVFGTDLMLLLSKNTTFGDTISSLYSPLLLTVKELRPIQLFCTISIHNWRNLLTSLIYVFMTDTYFQCLFIIEINMVVFMYI